MLETIFLVKLLSFIDDLDFIALGSSVKKIAKIFEKIAKKIITWEILNAVTYKTLKTKAVFFSKSHWQLLNKQFQKAKIKVRNEKI